MKPKTAEGREKDNSASTQNASDMRAEMDLLRQRLRALEACLPGAAPNPPPGRKVESRTAANAVVFLISVAVLAVLVGTGIVYGKDALNALFIDDNGNVGIGTEHPGATLDVMGTMNVVKEVTFAGPLTALGRVQIGKKTEEAVLDVAGTLKVTDNATVEGSLKTGGNVGIGLAPTGIKLEIRQNEAIKVGNAYLSSGGDYAHLANNMWFDGTKWQETAAGALLQLSGQETIILTHDGKGRHMEMVKVNQAGMTVNGSLQYQGVYQRNDEPETTRQIFPRYHLTLTGPVYRGSSKRIPQETLIALCGDEDGCEVRLGMTKWDNDTQTETASRSSLFYYSSGNGHWRASSGIAAWDASGIDGDGKTAHVLVHPWRVCHFTDGNYSKNVNNGDSQKGMELLMWEADKGKNQGTNRTCELTLID